MTQLGSNQCSYDGNCQGRILGGGLTAVAPDFQRGIATTIGLGVLYTAAIVAVGRLLQRWIGMPAILPMLVIFLILNAPSSGGSVQTQLLPGFWRFFSHFWAGASGVEGVREALYFNGAGVGREIAVLAAWTFAWIAILTLAIYRERLRPMLGRPGDRGRTGPDAVVASTGHSAQ
jgi:hypothetical protein